jgi:hypothetical protein
VETEERPDPILTEPSSWEDVLGRVTPPRRRTGLRLVLALLGLVAIATVLAVIPALAARARLNEARESMERGRALLGDGDTVTADVAFAQAEEAFISGLEQARNPFVRLASFLPIAGRSPDAVEEMARAGLYVAQAARVTTGAFNELPEGLAGLAPRDGVLPIDSLARIAPSLQRARELLGQAATVLDRSESRLLLGPVAEARREFDTELLKAQQVLRSAEALSFALPSFLGSEGPRRYFFGAQTPAELRGTGGLIGAYSILTVDGGRLQFGPFLPIQDLADVSSDEIAAPNPSYERRYERFGSAGFWLNINLTPDFPSAAQAIETLYEKVEGVPLDGTIVADPFALQALLEVVGPVEVPAAGETIDAENAVEFLANEAYSRFTNRTVRKRVLGDAARVVFDRFVNEGAADSPIGAARALIRTAGDGHVLMHAADPEINRAFEVAGVAGELGNPDGDFLGVIANNAGANKLDYYLDTSIRYEVRLREDGPSEAIASVSLTNHAPATGPVRVSPADGRSFQPGENRHYVSTYCAAGCSLESFQGTGEAAEVETEQELGHPVFSTFVTTSSGGTSNLEYRWTVPDARTSENGYTLTFQGQPTIRPTRLEIEIQAPEGTTIASASPGIRSDGNRAVWSGEAGNVMRFEVALQRPPLARAWDTFARIAAVVLIVIAALLGMARRRAAEASRRAVDVRRRTPLKV